jgi:hypothetical protein
LLYHAAGMNTPVDVATSQRKKRRKKRKKKLH